MRLPIIHIDGSALVHNYLVMNKLSYPAQCGAVVKANAYGVGVAPVTIRLHNAGCRLFYVASLDEGVIVRQLLQQHNLTAEIVVLHGYHNSEKSIYQRYDIMPTLKDIDTIKSWYTNNDKLSVIEWETGMHRCGLSTSYAKQVTSLINVNNVHNIMTHLACSDDPPHPLNKQQKQSFDAIKPHFNCRASIAASHGVLFGDEYKYDITRVGIALYGGINGHNLREVITVRAPILEKRTVLAGQCVGYGGSFISDSDRLILTVGFGYADGYLRAFSNVGSACLSYDGNIYSAPVIGRVSMDVSNIDVSHIPSNIIDNCTYVTFYHTALGGVTVAADSINTISYELLTSLKPTLARVID